ncbi:MAG: dimethylarginine dimethylaminohydrolase family protein [Lachnospiraceae bacterium]
MKTYVNNGTDVLKKVLLCPPAYFDFEPINVITEHWLEQGETANHDACMREHADFVQAYQENGVEVILMEPQEGLPYEVFARDFGASIREGYIAGRFREPCRHPESAVYEAKMKELGVPVVARCTSGAFEGGDFWMLDDYTIVHGIIARTDQSGFDNVQSQVQELGYSMTGVHCHRQNLHLDMCFNIVAEKTAVICSEALPDAFLQMLKKRNFNLIDVPQEGVFKHYCNLQCLGKERVLTFTNNRTVNEQLRALGLTTVEVDLVEILKGGGGPHCMTFPVERG